MRPFLALESPSHCGRVTESLPSSCQVIAGSWPSHRRVMAKLLVLCFSYIPQPIFVTICIYRLSHTPNGHIISHVLSLPSCLFCCGHANTKRATTHTHSFTLSLLNLIYTSSAPSTHAPWPSPVFFPPPSPKGLGSVGPSATPDLE